MSSLVSWGDFSIFLSIPSVFSVSELSRLSLWLLETPSPSRMPFLPPKECGYSSRVQLRVLHFSGEAAFKPQPT